MPRNFEKALYSLITPVKSLGKSSLCKRSVLEDMHFFLKRLGLDISALSVIHIAGTKGKGSSSAFCESLLRHHGVVTGFLLVAEGFASLTF